MAPITLQSPSGKTATLMPLGFNDLCAFEEKTGLTFGALMAALGVSGQNAWSLKVTRTFLRECHVEPKPTDEEIGTLVDEIGFEGIGAAVNGLIWPARKMELLG